MEIFKRIFVCKSESKSKNIIKPTKTKQREKIVNHHETAESIYCILDKVCFTKQEDRMYLLPGEWFDKLKDYINNPCLKTFPGDISNKYLNNRGVMVLLIYEALKEILIHFDLDFVYYINLNDSKINVNKSDDKIPILKWDYINTISTEKFKEIKMKNNFEDEGKKINKTFTFVKMTTGQSDTNKSIITNKINIESSKTLPKEEIKNKDPITPIREIRHNKDKQKPDKNKQSTPNDDSKSNNENIFYIAKNKEVIKKNDLNNENLSDATTLNSTCNYKSIIYFNLKKMNLKPKGLYNGSVYCFMNTGMQCLLSIPELNNYFFNQEYVKVAKSNNLSFSESYTEFINSYKDSKGSLKPPSSLYNSCHTILRPGRQHDCQEFLRRFLGKIQDEINGKTKYDFSKVKDYSLAWSIYKEKNFSIIDQTFAGMFKSCVLCHKCKHVSGK